MSTTTEPIPYHYKALFLTREESLSGNNLGLRFIMMHQDRIVDIADSTYELQTYTNTISEIVYQGKVYRIYKDFIFLEKKERIYLCTTIDSSVNAYDPNEVIPSSKPVVSKREKYDYLINKD